ncbi:MAG: DUF1376 domain-containing protein, partial [Patescibacteria group bacterium]|nr:DUF1376 domain-containing protein [Patescibacteria group bacterium]
MKIRHVDFSPDEFLIGVAGMKADEIGVYWVICSLIYSTGAPIAREDQRLTRLAGCHWRRLEAILGTLMAGGKVVQDHGMIGVTRCSRELQRAVTRTEQARHNGLMGGRPSSENSDLQKPDGLQTKKLTTNYQLSTTSIEGARKRARTKISLDWKLSESGKNYATSRGWSVEQIDREAEAFRDRNLKTGTLYADWEAAWRTWVQNAPKFAGNQRTQQQSAASLYASERAALDAWLKPSRIPGGAWFGHGP